MHSIFIFIANHLNRIKRKWMSLPLLFISPLIFISVLIVLVLNVFNFEDEVFEVGIVNNDDSEETEMLVSALSEATGLTDELNLIELNAASAREAVENNEVVSYIEFPDGFYDDMISGHSSEMIVTGNPDRALESYMVSEMVDTIVRYIRTSQANILTINHFAAEFNMDQEARHELVFQSFIDYFLQVATSGNMMDESDISGGMAGGAAYFILNGMFIVMTIWIMIIHIILTEDVSEKIKDRMKLLGVTQFAFSVSKVLVTTGISAVLGTVMFFTAGWFDPFHISGDNYLRVCILILLYIAVTVLLLEVIDMLVTSKKGKLLVSSGIICIVVFFAGAVVPAAYFPLYMTDNLDYIYSFESRIWIENIMLGARYTFEISTLLVTGLAAVILFIVTAFWKERRKV